MARYNHFSKCKYPSICFSEIDIGKKFRMDKHKNGRARHDIVMIKTGELNYEEFKSKHKYSLIHSRINVYKYEIAK